MILLNQFHQILTSVIVTLTVKEAVQKEANKPEMMNIFTLVQNVALVKNMEDKLSFLLEGFPDFPAENSREFEITLYF